MRRLWSLLLLCVFFGSVPVCAQSVADSVAVEDSVTGRDIVEKAKENGINIIGLSGVLTLAIDSMKDTVDAFKAAGMRDSVHIIVGGNPVTAEGCEFIGADAWAILPQETVRICREWALAGK